MYRIFALFSILISIFLLPLNALAATDATLWYDTPASQWTESLPLGNGRIGAMVYGGVKSDTITINESTFWSGTPYTKTAKGAMAYETVGNLVLTFPSHNGQTAYKRELSLDDAVARVSYTIGGVTYEREVFTSFADDVTIVRLHASKKGTLAFDVEMMGPQDKSRVTTSTSRSEGSQDELRMYTCCAQPETNAIANGVHCTTLLKVANTDGRCNISNGKITVSDATDALLVVSTATNVQAYNNITGDADMKARFLVNKFIAKGISMQKFSQVVKEHANIYRKQMQRVSLTLGNGVATVGPTTDRQLMGNAMATDGKFAADYFQYGRYLLICSSQKNGQPANAQGMWSPGYGLYPYAGSNFKLNGGMQECYWAAEAANMTESNAAYLQVITDVSNKGTRVASAQGDPGWVASAETDLWRGIAGASDVAYSAWLSSVLWDSYLYSGDRQYLSTTAFPVMSGAARYLLAHRYESDTISALNNQLIHDLLTNTSQAAQTIASSMWGQAASDLTSFADSLDNFRRQLPALAIGTRGQLQSCLTDSLSNGTRNDITHLWCAYPGRHLSVYEHPEMASAVKRSLMLMGDGGTAAAMAWKACLWARLLDGEHAMKLIQKVMTVIDPRDAADGDTEGGTYLNMVSGSPAFGIAGNLGCVAAMTEMLVQSHDDAVSLLPALPSAWKEGEVGGLRCRGGFEIKNMKWKSGKLTSVTISSTVGGILRLRSAVPLRLPVGNNLQPAASGASGNLLLRSYNMPKPVAADPSTLLQYDAAGRYTYDIPTNPGTDITLVVDK